MRIPLAAAIGALVVAGVVAGVTATRYAPEVSARCPACVCPAPRMRIVGWGAPSTAATSCVTPCTPVNAMLDRVGTGVDVQRRFVDDAGHELRTPITIVRGHLEVLVAHDPADIAPAVDLVDDELERMNRMVSDLLLLARSEHPAFLHPEPTDVGELTDDVFGKVVTLGEREWVLETAARVDAVVDPIDHAGDRRPRRQRRPPRPPRRPHRDRLPARRRRAAVLGRRLRARHRRGRPCPHLRALRPRHVHRAAVRGRRAGAVDHPRRRRRARAGAARQRRRPGRHVRHRRAGGPARGEPVSRILIAEDEPRISAFVEKRLTANGFVTTVVGLPAYDHASPVDSTCSCSTSVCRAWTASRSCARSAPTAARSR